MDDTEAPTPGICLIHRSLRRFILSNCSGELRNLANFDRSLQESTAQKKTVETRLQSLTRKGITNLADLLLSRGAGIFDWYHRSLANYHICDRHQQELEDNQPWRSSWTYARVTTPKKKKARTGILPCGIREELAGVNHTEEVVPYYTDTYMDKDQSYALAKRNSVFYPVGTPICQDHAKAIQDIAERHLETFTESIRVEGSVSTAMERLADISEDVKEADNACLAGSPQNIGGNMQTKLVQDLAKAMSDGNTPIAHVNRWAWTHYSFPARMRKLWQTHRFFKKTAAILHPGDGQQVLEEVISRYSKKGIAKTSKYLDSILHNVAEAFNDVAFPEAQKQVLLHYHWVL